MEQNSPSEVARKAAVQAERDSLLMMALLLEVYHKDPVAKERMTTTINMLSVENLRLLNDRSAPKEREVLLAAGVSSALELLKELPTLHWRLPSAGRR